jgi:putative tricarboxylic transport membrane protein
MTMSDERAHPPAGEPDILAELQAEMARELEDDRPPAGGPGYQLVGALVALALGASGAVLAHGYGLGTLSRPGAGLWPFLVSVLVVVLAIALLLGGRHLSDAEAFTTSSLLPIAGVITFVGLGALMPVIGFEIPSVLLCVVWLRFLGGETWRSTIVVSFVTVAAFYLLFLYGLRIPLPHLV